MTKSDWLTVAMIAAIIISAIATLSAPVLTVYIQSRISQHRPKPDAPQLGNVIQRLWWYLDLRTNWIFFIGMFVGFAIFGSGYVRAKNVVDRHSAFLLIVGAGVYFSFGMGFGIFKVLDWKMDEIKNSKKPQPKRKR